MQDDDAHAWPMELRAIADQLTRLAPPSCPGEAHPIDLLRHIATWLEGDADQQVVVESLLRKNYALTSLADDSFDSWHRIEFGSQARVDPDIKLAYVAGFRSAETRAQRVDGAAAPGGLASGHQAGPGCVSRLLRRLRRGWRNA